MSTDAIQRHNMAAQQSIVSRETDMPSRICHVSQKPSTAELILVSEGGGIEIEREVGGGGGRYPARQSHSS